MGKRIRSSWGLLALVVAALMVAAMVPAVGEHLPSGEDPDGAGLLRLHVGSDDRYFKYEPPEGPPKTQKISEKRCELQLESSPSLASFTPNQRGKTGLNGISIGVKSGGAQGVPCGRVDSSETLMLNLEDVPLAARADLDLELKGNAKVKIETYLNGTKTESFEVRSGASAVPGEGVEGTSGEPFSVGVTTDDPQTPVDESIGNCKNLSDSGPDAGSRDNCRVTVHPSLPFDAIKLVPTVGEVSLEGSGDFGNAEAADTIFYLTPWEGTLACGQTVTDADGDVTAEIKRLNHGECIPKIYRLIADADDENVGSVIFEFNDPAEQSALYQAKITFKYDLSSTVPLTGVLEYDPDESDGYVDFKEMPACVEEPFNQDGSPNLGAIPTAANSPDGQDHEGCVIEATQDWEGLTTWTAIFMGDWKFR